MRRITDLSLYRFLVIVVIIPVIYAQTPDPPFSKAKILKGLELGVTSKRMAALVNERGIDFSLTPEVEKELRQAGAGEELIEAIRKGNRIQKQEIGAGTTKTNPKDGLVYVWIPPGIFQMGCSQGDNECYGDEKPMHPVTITKGFWLGQTLVTQAAYQRVMNANPSYFHGDQLPVESVAWNQAKAYCEAVAGRLPTEAEWEYAARAGTTTARYGDLDAIAWYGKNSGDTTHAVAQKQPNAWGLYDMLGNVWELVGDWYDANSYKNSASVNPSGPSSGEDRVIRGGSWINASWSLRLSVRYRYRPDYRSNGLGFRCVRGVFP